MITFFSNKTHPIIRLEMFNDDVRLANISSDSDIVLIVCMDSIIPGKSGCL